MPQAEARRRPAAADRQAYQGRLWEGCPVTPKDADQGLAWLDQAEHCKVLQEQLAGLKSRLKKLSTEEQRLCRIVLKHLSPLDESFDPKGSYDLEQLISTGHTTGEKLEAANDKADELRESHDKAVRTLETANEEFAEASDAVDAWSTRWGESLAALNLEKNVEPDALESYLKLLDELRTCEDKIRSLQKERIEKMQAQIERYEADVQKHAAALAGDEVDGEADDIVKNLVQRLQESESNDAQRQQHENTIEAEKDAIADLEEEKQDYADTIARLADMAGTKDEDALAKAAKASDARRTFDDDIVTLKADIEKNGDNKSLQELREEAEEEDLDTAIAVLEELTADLETLEAELPQNIKDLQTAQAELSAIGDEGDAAAAEWQIQQGLNLILRNTTSILIAHRLSTILAADKILVLEDGRLIEQGTRYVQLFDWGWDFHGTNPKEDIRDGLTKKCATMDRPIAALIKDLKERGLFEDTLIILGGVGTCGYVGIKNITERAEDLEVWVGVGPDVVDGLEQLTDGAM